VVLLGGEESVESRIRKKPALLRASIGALILVPAILNNMNSKLYFLLDSMNPQQCQAKNEKILAFAP